MVISSEDMAQHIRDGRAQQWTAELGPDRDVLNVVRMDDAWYVILIGTDGYQPAPEPMATALSDWQKSLEIAAETIAAPTREGRAESS